MVDNRISLLRDKLGELDLVKVHEKIIDSAYISEWLSDIRQEIVEEINTFGLMNEEL